MKKFDHLTSLDAIDPLPCRLGGKVASGKPEETSYHMGQKLKPGFSIKGGRLTYTPPSQSYPVLNISDEEALSNLIEQVGKYTKDNARKHLEQADLAVKEYMEANALITPPDFGRDFDGDATTVPTIGSLFDAQIQHGLNSQTPVGSRKLNNSGICGTFLRKTPLFDPTEPGKRYYGTTPAKNYQQTLKTLVDLVGEVSKQIVKKHDVKWELLAKQFTKFEPGMSADGAARKELIVLDSLTPIVDQTVSLEKQPLESGLVTLELPKERLENKASLSVKIPVKAEHDTTLIESAANLKKVSPLTMNTDQIVQWLVALDATIAAGQIDRAAVASELLRVRRAQLKKCLPREELMNLSGTLTYAIARRFHTEPDGRFNFLRFSFRISVFRKTIAEIESFGPSRLIRFLRSVVSEEITDPTTIVIIPLVLRSMSRFQLHRVLNDDLSLEIPERYRVIMEKEEQRRAAESQA